MRGVSKVLARGVVVVAVAAVLSVPAEARGRRDDGGSSWIERARTRIVQLLQKFGGVTSFGDGLIDPRP